MPPSFISGMTGRFASKHANRNAYHSQEQTVSERCEKGVPFYDDLMCSIAAKFEHRTEQHFSDFL
ncbi:hypothetical protein AOT13_14615 [Parageobacillus thermoglucosidasius]|nr:hypothetical protein AOT13_14615 [Parageobacillus thermoglucosidasius]KJX68814.1 hypothetical protein WH82_10230 [Parageobacillus thermoglucosidasius]